MDVDDEEEKFHAPRGLRPRPLGRPRLGVMSSTGGYRALAEVMLREFRNPRWLCHNCAREHPMTGPAYPICECGHRCRLISVDNEPYASGRIAQQGAKVDGE